MGARTSSRRPARRPLSRSLALSALPLAAAAFIGLLGLTASSSREPPSAPRASLRSMPAVTTEGRSGGAAPEALATKRASGVLASAPPQAPVAAVDPVSAFQAWARYPPGSRPLAEHSELTLANHVEPTVRPLNRASSSSMSVRQEQDKVFVLPGEEPVIRIAAHRDGAPVTLQASDVKLVARGRHGAMPLSPPVVADLAGDGSLRARVGLPSAELASFRGDLLLSVTVRDAAEEGTLHFTFVYSGDAPATLSGETRERVEDGSLALYVGVDVKRAGRFGTIARVYDAEGKGVAYLMGDQVLAVGSSEMRLVVFGKLLRDAKAVFPLSVRELEGWRFLSGAYPDRERMAVWAGPYRTATYPIDTFSDAEWDAPNNRVKLAELRRALGEARPSH